jgi:V/A-type H+-transporting ATPase subunit I
MKMFTVPMKLLTAVVIDEAADTVKKRLLSLGLLDFIKISHFTPEQTAKLSNEPINDDFHLYSTYRQRLETLFNQAGFSHPATESLDPSKVEEVKINVVKDFVETISDDLTQIREEQKQISQLRIRYEELYRYLHEQKLHYVDIRIGKPEKFESDTLEGRLANLAHILITTEDEEYILLTLQRDRQQINPLMETLNWIEKSEQKQEQEVIVLLKTELQNRLFNLDEQNLAIKNKIKERILKDESQMRQIWSNLKLQELLGQIGSNFSRTRNTTLFSGWVIASEAELVEKTIREASNNSCVIEWTEAEEMPREQVPVAVEDVKILRPFQKLVDNYSVPEYGTINPTPFVALSYMAMFGLMFADAVQGLIIFLIGMIGTRYFKNRQIEKQPLISGDMYNLFIYLGLASFVSGVIFGSYFGFPLFKPLWFNYHEAVVGHEVTGRNVYSILKITIWFGIIIIGLGLVLNWINLIRKKDYFHLVMDKNGLIGGTVFGGGVYAAFYFVGTGYKSLPSTLFLLLFFGFPLLLLLGKIPLGRYLKKKRGETVERKSIAALIMDVVLEWIVEVLEIFSGFLANTLSFMRVAGLGIAHVSLMTAFMQMAEMTGAVGSVFILILGNALVIALEGLSAGIQALRLNYYEFFTKYFTGRGLSYNPITLRQNAGKNINLRNKAF